MLTKEIWKSCPIWLVWRSHSEMQYGHQVRIYWAQKCVIQLPSFRQELWIQAVFIQKGPTPRSQLNFFSYVLTSTVCKHLVTASRLLSTYLYVDIDLELVIFSKSIFRANLIAQIKLVVPSHPLQQLLHDVENLEDQFKRQSSRLTSSKQRESMLCSNKMYLGSDIGQRYHFISVFQSTCVEATRRMQITNIYVLQWEAVAQ